MRRMLARLGRVLLVVAVRLAQQTAIGHQYWHAASSLSAAADAKKAPNGEILCDLHDLLGTVLGLAGGMPLLLSFLSLAEPRFMARAAAVREAPPLSPHSRDPPLIS
jgi:hypothetical protein